MTNVLNFIRWALTHVNSDTIPKSATFVNDAKDIGSDPWHYLFGAVKVNTTPARIQERWENFYKTHGWSEEAYKNATKDMKPEDYATDCQGLLDAYITYELNEKTDINANSNYIYWCTDKGKISKIDRPYVIGEAVFMANSNGKMTHIGWICGSVNGEPLVVEARGLSYGVVITKLSQRGWTHRGLMTKKFDYSEERSMIKIEKTNPLLRGDAIKKLQEALNLLGYTDNGGNKLEEDGVCGTKTVQATQNFIKFHIIEPIDSFTSDNGKYVLKIFEGDN